MATLHLISRCLSPELRTQIKHSLLPDDGLVFLAEAIYSSDLDDFLPRPLYRLLSEKTFSAHTWLDKHSSDVEDIDYARFVQLGVDYERSLSWH